MSEMLTDVSHEILEELHRMAVAQARRGMIIDLLAAATLAAAAAGMWVGGWPVYGCFAASALGGGPATARGIARWRRLRRMGPREAESRGEL